MANYSLSVDGIALVAATAKSVIELAPTSAERGVIIGWWAEFDGVTATAVPVKIEVGRFSAAVTTATTLAASKMDTADGTATIIAKHSTTVEGAGTASDVENHRVNPTTGILVQYPLGREWVLAVSTFWRMRMTAAAAVNVTVGIQWAE